jgi:hypothetical protein
VFSLLLDACMFLVGVCFFCCSIWWLVTVVYDMWLGFCLGLSAGSGGGLAFCIEKFLLVGSSVVG